MTTTILTAVLCCVLLYVVRAFWVNKSRSVLDVDPYGSLDQLALRFDEICRHVLDPKALRFVRENAPAYAITSYRVRQGQLAQFSLLVASATVFRSLAGRGHLEPAPSIRRAVESLVLKTRTGFLLAVCSIGRLGLWIFGCLSSAVPRSVHSWVQSKVLYTIGATVSYVSHDLRQCPIAETHASELHAANTGSNEYAVESSISNELRGALKRALPNDVSRMIYIATLRDNNTGGYFHPDLARRFTLGAADCAMSVCHQEIFERLVSLDLEDLTDQLDVYFGSIRAPRARSVENWRRLRAYRATIPIPADPISAEILFMKIDVALAVLEARLPARPGS